MTITCVHGARDCPGYLGQSAQSDGHVGGQHEVSENAQYVKLNFTDELFSHLYIRLLKRLWGQVRKN